jgi:Putative transposase
MPKRAGAHGARLACHAVLNIVGELLRCDAAEHLGAEIGFFSVLHTWNQKLEHHPHIHCVVPAGGLSPDHTRWISSSRRFFLPVDVLAEVFRAKFVEALQEASAHGQLQFHGSLTAFARPKVFKQLLRLTFRKRWVVYSKRPFGGPEHALHYLGRYTHRVAISNHRLVSFADDQVTFCWRDSAHGNKKRLLTLDVNEFLRRFLLHVLPPGFVRIRYFGFLSTRNRSRLLPLCFQLADPSSARRVGTTTATIQHQQRATWLCPRCNGPMVVLERFTASQLRFRSPPDLLTAAA